MYHRIADDVSDRRYAVSPTKFEAQMRFLRSRGYRVVGLHDAVQAIDGRLTLPGRVVSVTFDDGFKDTYNHAYPILKSFGYAATFFLVSNLMGKESPWMSRGGYENRRLMDWADALQLQADGFVLGSHSATHPVLTALDDGALAVEIQGAKRQMEDRVGAPVAFFAYPYGIFDGRVRDAVVCSGFNAACSSQSGFNNAATDRYALRRVDVHGADSLRTFAWSLTFGENSMRLGRVARYYTKRALARFAL
jgi:peptidoglycan/xylan/chitin deacetylase (PgdA/CDA1 family)